MAATVPDKEPTSIVAGDTAKWTRSLSDYPASEGWALSYALQNSTTRYEVTPADITASDDDFSVTIPATETDLWTPGDYTLAGYVTLSTERYTVFSGALTVKPDLGDATIEDTRTKNEKLLDAIDAVIAGRITNDVLSYSIAGRSLTKHSLDELLRLRQTYAALVMRERGTMAQSYGVRFTQPC